MCHWVCCYGNFCFTIVVYFSKLFTLLTSMVTAQHVAVSHMLCIHKNEWARNNSYRRLTSRSPVQAENTGNHPVLVHSRSIGTSLIYSKTVLFIQQFIQQQISPFISNFIISFLFTLILPFKMLIVAAKLLAVSSVHKLLAHYVTLRPFSQMQLLLYITAIHLIRFH